MGWLIKAPFTQIRIFLKPHLKKTNGPRMNDWSHWYRVDGRQNRLYNKNNMCGLKNIGIPVDVPSSGATSRDFALARSLARSLA